MCGIIHFFPSSSKSGSAISQQVRRQKLTQLGDKEKKDIATRPFSFQS